MSISYNPGVVTAGLVFCVDAGNPRSYNGSGTSWNDVSGNALNGTLANSPAYTGGINGYFSFDGVDDYVAVPGNAAFNTPSVTYEVWANLQAVGDRHILYVNWEGNALEVNSDRSVVMYNWSSGGQLGATTNSSAFDWGVWTHFVGVYDNASSTLKTYINGVLLASRPSTPATIYNVTTHLISGNPYGGEVKGKISIVRHYNKVLELSEIQANYNAVKGRYGI